MIVDIPAQFNAARFFVDRHVEEGRGSEVAFHYEDTTLTYGGLQELVNRAGNALLDLGCPARAARPLPAARLARVPRHVLGRDQDRRRSHSRSTR